MPEPLILAVALLVAFVAVLLPLRRGSAPDGPADGDEREAALLRHRVALETLRDVEADRRAGSLDDAAYAEQLAGAEARAAATRAALDHPEADHSPVTNRASGPRGRLIAAAAAAVIGAVLLVGSALPATGIANGVVVNQALADAEAAESARQGRIDELLEALTADPRDAAALSALADEYLAGAGEEDLARAAVALQALIAIEPEGADAYERIIGAYLRAGDHANARSALTSYVALDSADPVEVAFFEGLIALREGDIDAAAAAFDRFLELAPDDPRAPMVRGLREEAETTD
jgi:cytochrome c-type biogenesis protein CcmH/NrfG